VSSFNESTLPQIAHAFTTSTSPPSAASSIYKCHNGVGKRILSLYHHGTSPSSSSSPLPPHIFDSNQLQMQLLPLEDSASLQNSNLEHGPDLMDALNGLNMPLQQDIMQDNKEFKFSDDNREFELKLGKAMDTLRKDYPEMLKSAPGRLLSLFFSLLISSLPFWKLHYDDCLCCQISSYTNVPTYPL